ncbi:hypothetical protein C8R45DRAFT_987990 [Mycena sanguinolenta]|nr:hypothetical protein C8R45DRAFT_987990 [Mycena sanguinolenta]
MDEWATPLRLRLFLRLLPRRLQSPVRSLVSWSTSEFAGLAKAAAATPGALSMRIENRRRTCLPASRQVWRRSEAVALVSVRSAQSAGGKKKKRACKGIVTSVRVAEFMRSAQSAEGKEARVQTRRKETRQTESSRAARAASFAFSIARRPHAG